MPWTPILISLGAIAGALMRYYITLFWMRQKGDRFPYGTLFVNLTGAFLIGTTFPLIATGRLPAGTQELVVIGFLGAYTTFSTYALDTNKLFQNRSPFLAVIYWLGSPLIGLICVELGLLMGKVLEKAMTLSF